jgi:hypothetical protein
VKKTTLEVEGKIKYLTMQVAEEITTIDTDIIKEVEGAKAASQNFISSWKMRQ